MNAELMVLSAEELQNTAEREDTCEKIMGRRELTPYTKIAYCQIAMLATNGKPLHLKGLAERVGLPERTFQRALAVLEEHRLLRVRDGAVIEFLDHPWLSDDGGPQSVVQIVPLTEPWVVLFADAEKPWTERVAALAVVESGTDRRRSLEPVFGYWGGYDCGGHEAWQPWRLLSLADFDADREKWLKAAREEAKERGVAEGKAPS